MRRIAFTINLYWCSSERHLPKYLHVELTEADVRRGAVLEDGRKVVEVFGTEVLLSDGEVMSAAAVVYGLTLDFTGSKLDFGPHGGVQTIAAGPDQDGRVLLESGHEIILFGVGLTSNPFSRQRERIAADSRAVIGILQEDRAFHIAAGFARP